jgi:DNA polymerase delta subunit 2
MLEDESGRIRLVGTPVQSIPLVTGVILGALGLETPNGDFEVIDVCYASESQAPSRLLDHDAIMDVDSACQVCC